MNYNNDQSSLVNSPGWKTKLTLWQERVSKEIPLMVEGTVSRMAGLTLEAVGCRAAIGERCLIYTVEDKRIEAEVVGFNENNLYLMPTDDTRGITTNARVIPTNRTAEVGVGAGLLGRVLNSCGEPIDEKGAISVEKRVPITGIPINPLNRRLIREPLDVGVRTINALLTIGIGQRIGLFAGSGVGKSVLLGMITKYTAADVIVLCLIGERGREVKEFIESILGDEGMRKTVVIVSPADDPPLKRLHSASLATSVAEFFRDSGKNVLLLMDSLTRYAQAQREIALSVGEPPATRGYPPSVFAIIPKLVERVGAMENSPGSITGIYTVLVEGNDRDDPIVDSIRATLDGHIFLDRQLADAAIFPAIDISSSISRVFTDVATPEQLQLAKRFKSIYSYYREHEDLISLGAYQSGTNPEIDNAISYYPKLINFINQDIKTQISLSDSIFQLSSLIQPANERK